MCARVSTRVCVHVHCTASPWVYAASMWTWRDLFHPTQLLSMFEIYYMGKSFPTAPPWEKNLTTLLQRKRQERNKKLDSFLYKHKSGIEMSM